MKLHRIWALLIKYWYITINRPDRIFDIFYWPMIDLFVWGFVSTYVNKVTEFNVLSIFLGGIILWVFIWRSSQDIAVYVLEDFWGRNLYHLFSSPIKLSEHMTSVITFAFFRSLVSFALLTVAAFFLWGFNIFNTGIFFLGIAVAILSLFGWVMGISVTAMIMRFGQRIQVLAWSVTWAIQPFSCVLYPLSTLPKWAVPIAKILPTTYVFENLRAILSGNPIQISGVIYAIGISIVLVILASYVLLLSFKRAKATGLLARGD